MFIPETEIIITKDGAELARATVKPGDYVIGSGTDADILVQADEIADRHALLTVNYHELFIEDLGSGRTSVAGSAVTESTRIWPSQKVRIGSSCMEARRIKVPSDTDQSLAPETELVRDLLPAEFLRERKYDIGGMMAQDTMGEIVDAFEATTGRTVAMKVMHSSLSEEEILRFVAEAQITSQLEHANIIPVHELGVDEEDHVFYTTKLVQGVTLRKILRNIAAGDTETIAQYPLAQLLTVFQKICDGVAFAHSRSVIHRQLKPSNITIGEYGEVLVMNWGNAGCHWTTDEQNAETAPATESSASTPSSSGTNTSLKPVSALSKAPAAANRGAETLDPQVDILALGAILYQILTLRQPETDGPVAPPSIAIPPGKSHLPRGRIPPSLAAVAMKALSADRGRGYASVPELQADITAYQDGYATSAEHASPWKQLVLLVGRHKREATALAASIAVLLALGVGAYVYTARERNVAWLEGERADHQRVEADRERVQAATERTLADTERARAEQTLGDLSTAAPAYLRQATTLIQVQKFEAALESIGFAITLAPDNPDYPLFRANTLQAMQRLTGAVASYRRVLTLRPADASATTNLELCERLLTDAAGKPLSRAQEVELLNAIVAQKRPAAGVFLASTIARHDDERMAKIKAQLAPATQQPNWNEARLAKGDDGTVTLDLSGVALPDLSLLRDLPISALNIARTGVSDLTPLAAMPLTRIDCSGNPISDLAPLRSRPLKQVRLDSTQIADLSPLKGMTLEELSLRECPVTDLTALDGMPLTTLNLAGTSITAIEALRGMPLRRLDCFRCAQLTDFSPLTTLAELETLNLPAQFTDLALLQKLRSLKRLGSGDFGAGLAAFDKVPTAAAFLAARGQQLTLQGKLAPRLELLRQALRKLGVPESKVATVTVSGDGFMDLDLTALPLDNLSPLAGLPLRRLVIKATKISDLTPLRGMPLTLLDASDTPVKDLTALAACPALISLDVSQTGVTDLRPLAGLKLGRLAFSKTAVQDLAPLQRMPLRALYCDETKVEDLLPLTTCSALESVTIPQTALNPNLLRKLPTLVRISNKLDTRNGLPAQSAAEFWASFDGGGKAREAEAKLNAALAKLKTLSGWKDTAFEKQPDGTYKLNLREVYVTDLAPLRDLPISVLDITETSVSRLGPLVNCPIRELYMEGCAITDLPILRRLPLQQLTMTQYGPGDLQHLRGLQLRRLRVVGKERGTLEILTTDLGPLKGMPLESLFIYRFNNTEDLKAVQDAPIKDLMLGLSGIKDLKPLRQMPLASLDIHGTPVSDLSPLRNLPLVRLNLRDTGVRDVSPLAENKTLEEIMLPKDAKGIEALRTLPNLRLISFEEKSGRPTMSAADFWKEFDAKKK